MLVAAVTSLLGLAVVLVAVYREAPLPPSPGGRPDWALLPTPSDIARTDFLVRLRGYDPVAVDAHLHAAAQAYADLLAVAPPEVVTRARQRSATRLGVDDATGHAELDATTAGSDRPTEPTEGGPHVPDDARNRAAPSSEASALGPGDEGDLRAQAVLGAIEGRGAQR